jgi:hypothetical protein
VTHYMKVETLKHKVVLDAILIGFDVVGHVIRVERLKSKILELKRAKMRLIN